MFNIYDATKPYWNQIGYSNDILERFWAKVDVIKDDEKLNVKVCWNWKAGKNKNDYGLFWSGFKYITSHRFIYECFNGPINNSKLLVCHSCDNSSCVNPYHLWLGTIQDNVQDKINKNRQAIGKNIGTSVLTEDKILEILIGIDDGVYTNVYDIVNNYNIGETTLRNILYGKTWKHITGNFPISLKVLREKIFRNNQFSVNNPNAKLTELLIYEILFDIQFNNKYINTYQIASHYNIHHQTIRNFLDGKTYFDITNTFCKKYNIKLLNIKSKVIKSIS
jgi:hypothetical protein